jgi:hypothetical protein
MGIESTAQTSPTIDTFDPSAIPTDTWKVNLATGGRWQWIRFLRAPISGGPHTIVFRCATPWGAAPIPGGSYDANNGNITLTLANGEAVRDVQITEIVKAGSSAGDWTVAP